jgi:hypothetical protein
LKKEPAQNKKYKKPQIQKVFNLTDEQRMDKLLDLIAEIAVDYTLKQVAEPEIQKNQAKTHR